MYLGFRNVKAFLKIKYTPIIRNLLL
jgi:hypothetical protein